VVPPSPSPRIHGGGAPEAGRAAVRRPPRHAAGRLDHGRAKARGAALHPQPREGAARCLLRSRGVRARRRSGGFQRRDPDGDPQPGYSGLSRGRRNRVGLERGGRMARDGGEVARIRGCDGGAWRGRGGPVSLEYAPVPFLSPAVQRGFGFFETALLVGRRAVLWEPHLDRMHRILSGLDLPIPSRGRLDAAAKNALDASPAKLAEQRALRLTWFAVGEDLDDPASYRLEAHLMPIPESRLARRSGSPSVSLSLDLQRGTPGAGSTGHLPTPPRCRLAGKRSEEP